MPSIHHASALRSPPSGPAAALQATADPFTAANPPGGFASLLRQVAPPAPAPAAPGTAPTTQGTPSPQAAETPPRQNASASTSVRQSEATQASAAETEATEVTDAAPANHARALLGARLRAAAAASGAARGGPAHPGAAKASDATDATDATQTTEANDRASSASETFDVSTASARDSHSTAPLTPLPPPSVAPIDPNILHWLAGLQRTAGPTVQTSGANDTRLADNASATPTAADSKGTAGEATARAHDPHAAHLKADVEANDAPASGSAARGAATDPSRFAAMLGELHTAEKPQPAPTPAVTGNAATAAAAAAAAMAPARQAGFERAAPVAVAIAAPVAAPEFAQVLGLQMSVLVRDGIQHAELHLNPAEMGPVSVQIVMDGTQARVDFGADLAATRQAIEAGLPELASALRDAGFTLAGGGVSQHSGGRSEAGDGGSGASSGRRHRPDASLPDDAASRVSAAARRIVAAGGIDLFA